MREIKFRAWDTELKMMVYENEQTGDTGYETNPVHAVNSIINEDYAEYIWMQYTGLKDKNGKEIYEGDIVEVDYLFNLQIKCEVIFEDGCFKVKYFVDNGIGGRLSEPVSIWINNFNYALSRIKVIGNIYENPELLEVEE